MFEEEHKHKAEAHEEWSLLNHMKSFTKLE